MICYIAGPITGEPGYRLKFAAVAYAIHKKKPDAAVLNPASLPAGMARSDYMAICLSMLMRADVVFLLPGWQTSGGAQIEKSAGRVSADPRDRDRRRSAAEVHGGSENMKKIKTPGRRCIDARAVTAKLSREREQYISFWAACQGGE